MRLFSVFTATIISIGLLGGCNTTLSQTKSRIIDPSASDELGSTGMESSDVRTMAEKISRSIADIRWPNQGEMPRIAFLPIQNRSRFRIDPKIISNKMFKHLVSFGQGRYVLLSRDNERAVMEERAKKRSGIYDQGNSSAAMAGADYMLIGEITALSPSARHAHSDYLVYTFKVVDAETGATLWVDDYETKKVGSIGVIYQ